jgi:four helix bundle protein
MPFEPLESRRVYQHAEEVADRVWDLVIVWDWFPKKTVGTQLARAADSIGANIAEAGGRFHPGDVRNFLYYSRGSLRETKYWLRRAVRRKLITAEVFGSLDEELEQLSREINGSINHQKTRAAGSSRTTTPPPHHPTTPPLEDRS